jgi:uncharacterized protein (DUF1800 family)
MADRTPTAGPWAAYTPGKEAPWDLRRVVHLHRRAGFAATWEEIQRDLKDGPAASIDRLLAGKARLRGVPEDFEQMAARLAAGASSPERLKAWWVYRMLFGPDPLTERLTLLWHDHFATSNDKVHDVAAMRRQNETFREFARAPFGELLGRAVRNPALLVWLDAPTNRKGHPNENLARELMELFTLGIGHYTEADVKEAARALTGWSVSSGAFRGAGGGPDLGGFREVPAQHDDGEKTILGRRGRWNAADLVKMLLEHPATSRRLARKLCDFLMGAEAVDPSSLEALAAGLRKHELDIGWAVATILRSRAFFAEANLGSRITGPVEYVVSSARVLELFDPPPGTLALAEWCGRLGQDLFYPPNVGGWPGGRNWISPQSMIGRANFAAALVAGALSHGQAADPLELPKRYGMASDLPAVITFYVELVQGSPPARPWQDRIAATLGPGAKAGRETVRRALPLILAAPEAQLG